MRGRPIWSRHASQAAWSRVRAPSACCWTRRRSTFHTRSMGRTRAAAIATRPFVASGNSRRMPANSPSPPPRQKQHTQPTQGPHCAPATNTSAQLALYARSRADAARARISVARLTEALLPLADQHVELVSNNLTAYATGDVRTHVLDCTHWCGNAEPAWDAHDSALSEALGELREAQEAAPARVRQHGSSRREAHEGTGLRLIAVVAWPCAGSSKALFVVEDRSGLSRHTGAPCTDGGTPRRRSNQCARGLSGARSGPLGGYTLIRRLRLYRRTQICARDERSHVRLYERRRSVRPRATSTRARHLGSGARRGSAASTAASEWPALSAAFRSAPQPEGASATEGISLSRALRKDAPRR